MSQDGHAVAELLQRLPVDRRRVVLVTCAPQDLRPLLSLPGVSVTVYHNGVTPGEFFHAEGGDVMIENVDYHHREHLNKIGFDGVTADLLWTHAHGSKNIFDDYQFILNEEGYVVFGATDSSRSVAGAEEVSERFREKTYPGIFHRVASRPEVIAFYKAKIPRDIRFAVINMTYRRPNGSSRKKLEQMMRCINSQSYKNFTLFLMGDDYEDEEELRAVGGMLEVEKIQEIGPQGVPIEQAKPDSPTLYLENVKPALERSKCKKKYNLWCVGGANTLNVGLRRAREQAFAYYAHIDDDDVWHPHHLLTLATAYHMFPETTAAWTRGVAGRQWIEPRSGPIGPNNFLPVGRDCFHSTFSFRLDKIKLEYTTIDPDMKEEEEPDMKPADCVLAATIGILARCGLAVVVAVPLITCYRRDEGSMLRE